MALHSWDNEDIIIKKLGDDSLKVNSLVARHMSGPIRKRLKQLKQKEIKKARLKQIKNLEIKQKPHACCRNHIGLTFNEQTTMVDLTTWYCTIALLWIPPPVNKCSN
tara:strand:- start:352 stop:672 length:321 start_codon:yes stop_codon:yes gene_type:complete